MRIGVLNKDRCKPKDCNYLCIRICPVVKTGGEAIVKDDETKKPIISEELCTGCGICPKKCPFGAITIVNLPEEIGKPVHQYGVNGFRLYNLPVPREGVVGIVGANGIGKTTALKILSGEIKPNLGQDATWDEIIERFKGNELQTHLEKLSSGKMKAVMKPQYVDAIPRHVKGKVGNLLKRADERGALDDIVSSIGLENALNKKVADLSGGELQMFAIAACLLKEVDIYLLDEPSSYLDVGERLRVAKVIMSMKDYKVLVVEHDLIVLDYLSDHIHVIFGTRGAYGIISNIKGVRVGINEYLGGFLRSENMRFRGEIRFDVTPPTKPSERDILVEYPKLQKSFDEFSMEVEGGSLHKPSIRGILGPNATGKTTFVKMLANAVKPDNTDIELGLTVSYKPQYIKLPKRNVSSLALDAKLIGTFDITDLMDKKINELSGGELQKVAIVDCLSKEASIYLLDEPSAYLDVEERLRLAKYIKKYTFEKDVSVLVVDHDILLIDYLSEELMIFSGEAGKSGKASGLMGLKEGMNKFLKEMDITFRRDPESGRPRANKPGSLKDREQKSSGDYYYVG